MFIKDTFICVFYFCMPARTNRASALDTLLESYQDRQPRRKGGKKVTIRSDQTFKPRPKRPQPDAAKAQPRGAKRTTMKSLDSLSSDSTFVFLVYDRPAGVIGVVSETRGSIPRPKA